MNTELNCEFKKWDKINRLKDNMITITEKINGTNACVIIEDGKVVGCQSRNRLVKVGDHFGFPAWVEDNAEEIVSLGDGYHYGEWAGPGIQKNLHKLEKKTFFLFRPEYMLMPGCISVVPILYQGPYSEAEIKRIMFVLKPYDAGAQVDALSGKYVYAEGIVVYFHDMRQSMKLTFENQEGKWKDETN